MTVHLAPATRAEGEICVPGDKSISHRALLLAALADGASTITGLSPGLDVQGTRAIIQQLGAKVDTQSAVHVEGPRDGLRASTGVLDCGNSGTTARLLLGLLASVSGEHHIDGDESLRNRPMGRVLTPLSAMGLAFQCDGIDARLPLVLVSRGQSRALVYDTPVPSAQVKGALLLAGLVGDGPTTVSERSATRTNTEDMLSEAGIRVDIGRTEDRRLVTVWPGRPRARHWNVPGDPSQAAFFAVLASLLPGGLNFPNLYMAPERTGFLRVLERMGVGVTNGQDRISVNSGELSATEVLAEEIPSVDEVPALSVACAAAHGVSVFRGVGELRLKESDRFAGTLALMEAIGAQAWDDGDDLYIRGLGSARKFKNFSFGSALDHRMVMAASIAGVVGSGVDIVTPGAVATSYPTFFADLESVLQ
jgi:3-phosphoshikimate 1-carboxyvinyltransferase